MIYVYKTPRIGGRHENIPRGMRLWATVERYDSSLRFRNGPLQADQDGRFTGLVPFGIDGSADVRKRFIISIVIVPDAVSLQWEAEARAISPGAAQYLRPLPFADLLRQGVEPLTSATFVLLDDEPPSEPAATTTPAPAATSQAEPQTPTTRDSHSAK